jgi:hypothetical protein
VVPGRKPAAKNVAGDPEDIEEGITEVEPLPEPKKRASAETQTCPECGKKVPAKAAQCRYCKADLAEADEPKEGRRKKKPKYKACPQCGAGDPKKVTMTWWGSVYGPLLFSHVRCRDCGYAYNGKTGRSNLVPIILFVTIPAILIVALIAFIVSVFVKQGYFDKDGKSAAPDVVHVARG